MKALIGVSAAVVLLTACGGGSDSNDGEIPYYERAEYTVSIVDNLGNSQDVLLTETEVYSFPIDIPDNYAIQSVEGCGGSIQGEDVYQTAPLTGHCEVVITFESLLPPAYIVDANVSGYGGSVVPHSVSVLEGESTTFFVEKKDGYNVSASGCSANMDNGLLNIESVDGDCTLDVQFSPTNSEVSQINVVSTGGGDISPTHALVNSGESIEFTVTSLYGFGASVDGCGGTLEDELFTIDEVDGDCTINATFDLLNQNDSVVNLTKSSGLSLHLSISLLEGPSWKLSLIHI